LGEALGGGGDFGDGFAVAGAGEVDHGDVAAGGGAVHGFKADVALAEEIQRVLDIGLGHGGGFAFDGQAVVFGELEFGGGFDGGGELEGLAAAELDFLDVRVADDVEFLLVHSLAVGVGDELLLD